MFKRANLRVVVDTLPFTQSARRQHVLSAMIEDFHNFKIEDNSTNRIAYLESVYTFLVHQPQTTKTVHTRWVVQKELLHLKNQIHV